MIDQATIDNWFTYHPPTDEHTKAAYQAIRQMAHGFADLCNAVVPDCADKTAAFRDLRNCVMAMNLAIACNGGAIPATVEKL